MHSLKRTLGAPALAVLGFLTMATAPADAATPHGPRGPRRPLSPADGPPSYGPAG